MRNVVLACSLAVLGAFARAEVVPFLWTTADSRPVVVAKGQELEVGFWVDESLERPACICFGKVIVHTARRLLREDHERSGDPGLGTFPEIQPNVTGFSEHDFCRAFVAAFGTVDVQLDDVVADTWVNLVANTDGTPGVKSRVVIGKGAGCRFGVLASGQDGLFCSIAEGSLNVYKNDQGDGHLFYANESTSGGKYLRLKNPTVVIGKARSVAMAPNLRKAYATAKFKGSWNIDYRCFDDQNSCSFFDSFGSSGNAWIVGKHPGGDYMNGNFAAFRLGNNDPKWGAGDGNKVSVRGSFDMRLAPNQLIQIAQVETPLSSFSVATFAGCGAPVVWAGCSVVGLSRVANIEN